MYYLLNHPHIRKILLCLFVLAPILGWLYLLSQHPLPYIILDERAKRITSYEQRIAANPNDDDAAQKLVGYLNKSDGTTIGLTLRALGNADSTSLDEIQIIAPHLTHSDHFVRRSAILAVKDRGDEALLILDAVIDCLDDWIGIDVRVFAADVLRSLGADAAPALPALRDARALPANSSSRSSFERAIQDIEEAIERQNDSHSP